MAGIHAVHYRLGCLEVDKVAGQPGLREPGIKYLQQAVQEIEQKISNFQNKRQQQNFPNYNQNKIFGGEEEVPVFEGKQQPRSGPKPKFKRILQNKLQKNQRL